MKDRIVFALLCFCLCDGCSEVSPPCQDIASGASVRYEPRPNESIELLAARLSPGAVADQKIYDRLAADLQEIRSAEPAVRNVQILPAHDGRTLFVKFESVSRLAVQIGLYDAWNCLNRRYHGKVAEVSFDGTATIRFQGIYDLEKVAREYAQLPSVVYAEPNRFVSYLSTFSLCVTPTQSEWNYVFNATGQPSDTLYYFTTDPAGTVHSIDHWTFEAEDGTANKRPDWVANFWNEKACRWRNQST